MPQFTVKWIIQSITAESPLEAAQIALDWIKDEGECHTFTIQDEETKKCHSVDLDEEPGFEVTELTEGEFKNS